MKFYQDNKLMMGEEFSKEKFESPSKEFGIMPFWFVNGALDYEEMDYQLKEFADKGIPAIYFHSRFGIKDYMPYLGEEWLDRYNYTVERAKEYGLQVWVYDEYNWPSGTADQTIQKDDPNLTSRYLELIVNEIPGQYFMFMEGTDSRYNDLEQSEPVFACAILEEDIKNQTNEIVNLMPNLAFDKVIAWEAPEGPWQFCYFIERKASWYTDVLNEKTTQEFIQRTHEKYKDNVPGDVKDSIVGFYTDEPAMHYFMAGADNYTIPWSSQMFKIFYDHNGYQLKERLPQLYFPIGDDYHQVRHDFWSALSKQYEKAFYGQIRDWCDENEVVFTGHLLHEEWVRRHAKSGGNLFHMLKHMHLTGVDHLYPRIGTRDMPEEHVALKIASSAAHHHGSTRLLCESMGGAYWDCTMERMKWIADWEYVLGVNILNPHGFHYSIEGERKRDWPPSQFYHHTWWKDYDMFNDYLKRAGYLLTGGHHVARVAMLYPINNIWANFVPQGPDAASKVCTDDFEYLTDELLRIQYDYDYIDEDHMLQMEIEDGIIAINGEAYELLILPPITHIKERTLGLIKEFYEQGGKILASTLLPVGLIDPNGEVGLAAVEEIFGVDSQKMLEKFLAGDVDTKITRNSNANGGEAVVIHGMGLAATKNVEAIESTVSSLVEWDVSIDNDEMFYLHRIKDEVPFYFVINPVDKKWDSTISIRHSGQPKYYDLLTGEITDILHYTREGEVVHIPWTMYPYDSAMFSFEETEGAHVSDTNFKVLEITDTEVIGTTDTQTLHATVVQKDKKTALTGTAAEILADIPFATRWDFETSIDNALVIQSWKFAMADDTTKDFFQPEFDTTDWLDYTMGGWEHQLPFEREEKTYPVDVLYKASFTVDYLAEDMKIIIDGFKGSSYDLYINGERISDLGERSFLDAEMKQIFIKGYVNKGHNDIALRITVNKAVEGLLDYIKITGTFALEKVGEEYTIVSPATEISTGTWTTQGYPYFSGSGLLTQTLEIPKEYLDGRRVELHVDCGKDVLDIAVGDTIVGTCIWQPYTLDITDHLVAGENKITLTVTNTLNNILNGVAQDSGVFEAHLKSYSECSIKL